MLPTLESWVFFKGFFRFLIWKQIIKQLPPLQYLLSLKIWFWGSRIVSISGNKYKTWNIQPFLYKTRRASKTGNWFWGRRVVSDNSEATSFRSFWFSHKTPLATVESITEYFAALHESKFGKSHTNSFISPDFRLFAFNFTKKTNFGIGLFEGLLQPRTSRGTILVWCWLAF